MTTFKHKPHFVDGAKHHLTPDAQETPPVPCDFKLGDKVTFTNDNGIAFHGHVVTGFSPTVEGGGRFVYLDKVLNHNENWAIFGVDHTEN